MVITLFGATTVRPGKEGDEEEIYNKLKPILEAMPGFISIDTYVSDDGEELGVIRFDSRESLDAWMNEGEHAAARKRGSEIYEGFWIQTAETYREYKWDGEKRVEGDLTDLFSES